jgi:Raf kinase inhibitor-like YbhB/YbcL family protein
MKIFSPVFTENGTVPVKYTCDGENINPPLMIEGVPDHSKSLVLIMDDPDAPAGLWTHWILYNLPVDTQRIEENSAPGNQGINSANEKFYQGPCPPGRVSHRYHFHLYALDSRLEVPDGITRKQIDTLIQRHTLDLAEIIAYYPKIG